MHPIQWWTSCQRLIKPQAVGRHRQVRESYIGTGGNKLTQAETFKARNTLLSRIAMSLQQQLAAQTTAHLTILLAGISVPPSWH